MNVGDATLHPLARDYLARLTVEASRLPVDEARDLISDITEHLTVALDAGASDADVRNILDRLGSPADVAAAPGLLAGPATAGEPAQPGLVEIGAIVALLAAELLVPIGLGLFRVSRSVAILAVVIIGASWAAGLALVARSHVWTGREKLRGLVALATGVVVVFVPIFTAVVGTSACVETGATPGPVIVGQGPDGTTTIENTPTVALATCSSGFPWFGAILIALLTAYGVAQFLTARALLRRRTA